MNNSNNPFNNNNRITPQQPNNNLNGNITSTPLQSSTLNQNNIPSQPTNNFNQKNSEYSSNNLNSMNSTPINNINNINPKTVNTMSINQQTNPQQFQNLNNNLQNQSSNPNFNDEDLLKAFIGNNYDKINPKTFNFAGFFFTTFYMFYRKMFLYSILLVIVNLIISNFIIRKSTVAYIIVAILFGIIIGLFVNKIYIYYAKKKIAKIKLENPQKNLEELKNICSTKGGTSFRTMFLGIGAQLGIALIMIIIMMFMGLNSLFSANINDKNNSANDKDSTNTGTLVENVTISGYSCFGTKCTISIEDSNGNMTNYVMNSDDGEFFNTLSDYTDYIKVNIYYTSKGNEKTISSYKIYLKSNNEDISSIKTENELRDKIGLYSIGTHTDTFTLKKIGAPGFGYKDNVPYTYTTYIFVDNQNVEYEMKYINSNGTLNLTVGNKYTVTFEVTENTFDYEFNIKSVK